ncbi:MAG: hypothetical protein GC155_13485 [Alphaproteobacteria bacterium]|nr:hypothetical protein [Alphaproteobacteria bacterium]
MTHTLKTSLLLATVLAATTPAFAQAPRAYGHWEGVLNSPFGSASLLVDIGADAVGRPIAAISLPDENVNGLPLGNVKFDGDTVAFELPTSGEGTFVGTLSSDGKSIAGTFDKGVASADFSMTRTGDARFPVEPKNKPVDARFVGEWTGTLASSGHDVRVSLSNQSGGAIGRISVENGVGVPLGIEQSGDMLKLNILSANESFSGRLAPSGKLVGDYFSGDGAVQPLSLARSEQ